eukprot:44616_1
MSLQLEIIQSYILYGIWLLISVPTICYMSYQLKQNWNEPWLLRRRRPLILIICVLLFYIIGIECPSYTISYISPKNILTTNIYAVILTISMVVKFWAASFILLRIYLLYYDHEYNRMLTKNKWKILIDPIGLPKQASWWLINRQRKYGDEEWMIYYIVLPFTIPYTLLYIIIRIIVLIQFDIINDFYHIFYYVYDVGFTAAWIFTAIGIGTYFWKKYPKFADIWLIRKEISISLFVQLFNAMQQIILLLIIQPMVDIPLTQLSVAIFSIFMCFGLYVIVVYPQTAEIRKSKALRNKITDKEQLKIRWEQLVTTKDGYESFMGFLEKELSTENLLFITEYVQLKWRMTSIEILRKKINDEIGLLYDLNFPESLPLSVIAKEFTENMNTIDMDDWNKINEYVWSALNEMYDKYINENTADLEVNISSRKRKAIKNVFENNVVEKTIENILPPMEHCVMEISLLLNDSRGRFCENIEFTELALSLSKSQSVSKSGKRNTVNASEIPIGSVPSRTDVM